MGIGPEVRERGRCSPGRIGLDEAAEKEAVEDGALVESPEGGSPVAGAVVFPAPCGEGLGGGDEAEGGIVRAMEGAGWKEERAGGGKVGMGGGKELVDVPAVVENAFPRIAVGRADPVVAPYGEGLLAGNGCERRVVGRVEAVGIVGKRIESGFYLGGLLIGKGCWWFRGRAGGEGESLRGGFGKGAYLWRMFVSGPGRFSARDVGRVNVMLAYGKSAKEDWRWREHAGGVKPSFNDAGCGGWRRRPGSSVEGALEAVLHVWIGEAPGDVADGADGIGELCM